MTGSVFIGITVVSPFVAALISFILGKFNKSLRDYFVAGFTLLELVFFAICFREALNGSTTEAAVEGFMTFKLHFKVDGFRFLYATIALLMWAMCSLASKRYFAHYHNRNRYYFFWLVTLGATLGVFLSNDLITSFLFFEIMSFASYVFVAQEETQGALRAAETYLAVAVIGGLVSLMGIFMCYDLAVKVLGNSPEALTFESLAYLSKNVEAAKLYVPGALVLFGFGAKAGIYPLHIWLPKAHPVAPAPASAVLSGMLTKVGIFGTILVCCRMFAGDEGFATVMLVLALITMLLGAVLALFSVDLKRTLACSSVSQIGFILTGISMYMYMPGNQLAVSGSFLHMMNHSLFKLALFLVAGVVMQNLHKLNLNEIRGFGRKKYYLMVVYLCAALGIGGIPMWSGYISKTLIHEAIVEGIEELPMLKVAEILFLLAGGITLAYMTKLFVALFIEKNLTDEETMRASDKNYITLAGRIAIGLPAVLVFLFGLLPHVFYDFFAKAATPFFTGEHAHEGHVVHYFAFENLKGAIISLVVGTVLYFGVVRTLLMKKEGQNKVYVNRWPEKIDLENGIYRPLIKLLADVCGTVARAIAGIPDAVLLLLRKTVYKENALEKNYIGTPVTYFFGNLFNGIANCFRKEAERKDYAVIFAEKYEVDKRKLHLFESSLSFGLFMFCIGLCITMIYLLAK